jgi:hypothetical protein
MDKNKKMTERPSQWRVYRSRRSLSGGDYSEENGRKQ